MIKKIINDIKTEYRRNKIVTGFMGLILALAILTYLKPASTSGILNYIGLSIINFIILTVFLIGIWWFLLRKRK